MTWAPEGQRKRDIPKTMWRNMVEGERAGRSVLEIFKVQTTGDCSRQEQMERRCEYFIRNGEDTEVACQVNILPRG